MKKTGIKLLCAALTLVLLAGLLPAAALAADHTHAGWTKWTATDSLPTAPGNYTLSGNVMLRQSWLVPNGTTKLCLEGHSIIFSGSSGCVIQIPSGATLELSDLDGNNGLITGGKGNDGGAEYLGGGVSVKGTFIMNGGQINGNTASTGGGVFIASDADFTMNGGIITGNSASVSGGGVMARNQFTISGGATVMGNTKGGAANNVRLEQGKIIRVSGALSGTIGVNTVDEPTAKSSLTLTSGLNGKGNSSNFSSDASKFGISTNNYGELILTLTDPSTFRFPAWESTRTLPAAAGDYSLYDNVRLSGTWTAPQGTTRLCLEGRSISLDAGTGCVIEVPAGATLELFDRDGSSGVITGGKGLDLSKIRFGGGVYVKGEFRMYGGSVTGNTADNGGGVYVDSAGTFRLNGGSITKNTATISGGGVAVDGTFSVSGASSVSGNTISGAADNVYLASNKTIVVTSAFSGSIGANTAIAPTAGAPQVLTSGLKNRGAASSFFSDKGGFAVGANNDGEAILSVSGGTTPGGSGNLKFLPWTAADAMPDKAGDYSLSGNVTLRETWTVPQGTTRLSLEGRSLALSADNGSVINVPAGATLELYDGAGNTGVVTGGKGMFGSGFYLGGGVYVSGSFTQYGGTISGNSATSGGGVYVDTSGVCRLFGGRIAGNSVSVNGGGMFVRGKLEVAGAASVTDNKQGTQADNIRLAADRIITVTDKLSGTFGVNTATAPTSAAPTAVTAGLKGKGGASNFQSDDAGYSIGLNAGGEAILSLVAKPAETINYTEWKSADKLPDKAGDFKLTCDVLLRETWTAPTGRIRLHLNGHTISLSAASGSVLQIPSDTVLELYDLENNSGVITRGKGRSESGASTGGGVFVRGTFNMFGGRILGNAATSGGGVYVDSEGVFRMRGGEITGNTVSAGFGGGVFVRGTMEVSGAVNISGNSKKNGSADNVRLAANQDIHVTGALSGSIGVNKALKPEQGSPVTVSAGLSGRGTAAIFSSDDKAYTIILTDAGEVLLSVYCPRDKTCPMSAYTDLKPTEWYHDGIHFVLQSGFMSGYSTKLFGPGDNTTRAMVATIIWNMAGKPKADGKIHFTDVENGKWFTDPIRWAAGAGIIVGYTDGITGELIFCPNDSVTREQLATMMYRYAQYMKVNVSVGESTNILSYDDSFGVSSWAASAMQWSVGSGLMGGRTAHTLDPKANATRAEVATVVMRYATTLAK